jgi:hypothetical protein
VLCADEVKSIIIAVYTVVYIETVHVHAFALNHADAVVCAIDEIQVAYSETFTAICKEMIGAAGTTDSAGRLGATHF